MISIFVPFRNAGELARECLNSLSTTMRALRFEQAVEYVFVDDASDARFEIPGLLLQFRKSVTSHVDILRLKEHQHYTGACAYGLSRCKGNQVILVSHDMFVTPDYVRTLLAVAASDAALGIIRGTSGHMDGSPHQISPPTPIQTYADVMAFSSYISGLHGLSVADDVLLIGDSMLIQRPVLSKIGVMDRVFFGLMGDVDFGIRAQRAGYKLATAKGAWLHHTGRGAMHSEIKAGQITEKEAASRGHVPEAAYRVLREKWLIPWPPTLAELRATDFAALRSAPPPGGGEFVPPPAIDPQHCEIL